MQLPRGAILSRAGALTVKIQLMLGFQHQKVYLKLKESQSRLIVPCFIRIKLSSLEKKCICNTKLKKLKIIGFKS